MNEHLDPDLVSAYLDGELPASERARLEADPEAMRVIERHRVVVSSLQAVGPPTAATRERAISAALDAAVDVGLIAPVAAPDPDLRHPRALRAWWNRDTQRRVLALAAAAVAVVAVGAVAVTGLRGVGDDDSVADGPLPTQIAAEADEPDAEPPAEMLLEAPAADSDDGAVAADEDHDLFRIEAADEPDAAVGAPAAPGVPLADLGRLDGISDHELRQLMAELLTARTASAPADTSADTTVADPADDAVAACAGIVDPVVALGLSDGELVVVGLDPERSDTILLVDPLDCSIVRAVAVD